MCTRLLLRRQAGSLVRPELLFVYGTLRKGATSKAPRLLADCPYVASGYMSGRLYEIAGYPGAVESSNPHDRVVGELYALDHAQQLFSRLDAYEECSAEYPAPHEYLRKTVPVHFDDGTLVEAWTYLYNRATVSLRPILSGDYLGPGPADTA